MVGTFYALLPLADLDSGAPEPAKTPVAEKKESEVKVKVEEPKRRDEEHSTERVPQLAFP
jgi:hypothetical protein